MGEKGKRGRILERFPGIWNVCTKNYAIICEECGLRFPAVLV